MDTKLLLLILTVACVALTESSGLVVFLPELPPVNYTTWPRPAALLSSLRPTSPSLLPQWRANLSDMLTLLEERVEAIHLDMERNVQHLEELVTHEHRRTKVRHIEIMGEVSRLLPPEPPAIASSSTTQENPSWISQWIITGTICGLSTPAVCVGVVGTLLVARATAEPADLSLVLGPSGLGQGGPAEPCPEAPRPQTCDCHFDDGFLDWLSRYNNSLPRDWTEFDGQVYYDRSKRRCQKAIGYPIPDYSPAIIESFDRALTMLSPEEKEVTRNMTAAILMMMSRVNFETTARFSRGTELAMISVFGSLVGINVVGMILLLLARNAAPSQAEPIFPNPWMGPSILYASLQPRNLNFTTSTEDPVDMEEMMELLEVGTPSPVVATTPKLNYAHMITQSFMKAHWSYWLFCWWIPPYSCSLDYQPPPVQVVSDGILGTSEIVVRSKRDSPEAASEPSQLQLWYAWLECLLWPSCCSLSPPDSCTFTDSPSVARVRRDTTENRISRHGSAEAALARGFAGTTWVGVAYDWLHCLFLPSSCLPQAKGIYINPKLIPEWYHDRQIYQNYVHVRVTGLDLDLSPGEEDLSSNDSMSTVEPDYDWIANAATSHRKESRKAPGLLHFAVASVACSFLSQPACILTSMIVFTENTEALPAPHWLGAPIAGQHPVGSLHQQLAELAPPDKVETEAFESMVEQKVLFKEIGAVTTALTWGHVLFSLDLNGIDNLIDSVTKSAKGIFKKFQAAESIGNTAAFSVTAPARLKSLYEGFEARMAHLDQEWQTYRDTFYHAPRAPRHVPGETMSIDDGLESADPLIEYLGFLDRVKRIIPLIAAAIIGGGALLGTGLGFFNTWQLSQIEKGNAQRDASIKFILEKIQNHDDDLQYLKRDVLRMNETQEWISEHVRELMADRNLDRYADFLDQAHDIARSEAQRVMSGMNALLMKSLSPQLINSTVLKKALGAIEEQARGAGFSTPLDELGLVYQLPASFLAGEMGMITVFIHIPLLQQASIFGLYHYQSMPIALKNSVHSVELEVETEFLAISTDRDSFIMLSNSQLATCQKLGKLYLCPNTNYELTRPDDYCITSLFLHRSAKSALNCPTSIVPERTVVRQQNQETFYIFHPTRLMLTIECGTKRPQEKLEFRGSRLVKIPPGCFGITPSYTVSSHEEYTVNMTVKTAEPLWRIGSLIQEVPLGALGVLYPRPPLQPVKLNDIRAQYDAAMAMIPDPFPWHWNFGFSFITTVLIVVGVGCVLYACRRRLGTGLKGFLKEDHDRLEMVTYRGGTDPDVHFGPSHSSWRPGASVSVDAGLNDNPRQRGPPPVYTPAPSARATPRMHRSESRNSFYTHMQRAARSVSKWRARNGLTSGLNSRRSSLVSTASQPEEVPPNARRAASEEPHARAGPPRTAPPPPPNLGNDARPAAATRDEYETRGEPPKVAKRASFADANRGTAGATSRDKLI
jgi:hypothetical protein